MLKKSNKIIASILLILVFLCLLLPKAEANFFTDDWGDTKEEKSEIEETIDSDDGGIFEKIIAKMIGGIAESVLSLTTNKELGVGFKNYDELIFAKNATDIAPFTEKQWNTMMEWYKVMASIAGSLILIAVIIVAYKFIMGAYSIESRNEAKNSLMRLFFGAVCIVFAPIFVKFLLLINNNLVRMITGFSNSNLEKLLGNGVLTNIQTGNAIATSIIIALFAYLFFKLNIKFIIRQFTILVFTIFTPIVAVLWMINKRTIGAAIWFGQIFINVFMQFIYAFLFLIYMKFLPESGGWAVSLLWAMMILPLADALGNTLQNLVSRIAGINNDELANRGIGMAGAMAHSIKAITYQFKGQDGNSNISNNTNFLGRFLNGKETETNNQITPMKMTKMGVNSINTPETSKESKKESDFKSNTNNIVGMGRKAYNTGKEMLNMGMYVAEGKNYNKHNINNTRKEDNIVTKKQDNYDKI